MFFNFLEVAHVLAVDQEVEVVLVNHVQSLVVEVAVEVVALNQRVNHAVDPSLDPNRQDQIRYAVPLNMCVIINKKNELFKYND